MPQRSQLLNLAGERIGALTPRPVRRALRLAAGRAYAAAGGRTVDASSRVVGCSWPQACRRWCRCASPAPRRSSRPHGLAMHGDLKYPAGLHPFRLCQPASPQGRQRHAGRRSAASTASTPSSCRATPAAGIGLIYETLTVRLATSRSPEYGLLAETIELPQDRSFVALRRCGREARWHDGQPVTPEDVVWSFDTLKPEGHAAIPHTTMPTSPRWSKTGDRQVTFTFDGSHNRELPLILGQLPVLPEHYWCEAGNVREAHARRRRSAAGPTRSSASIPAARSPIERVADYWGAEAAGQRGPLQFRHACATTIIATPTSPSRRSRPGDTTCGSRTSPACGPPAYTGPAVDAALIVKERVPRPGSGVMQGFVFNLRRPIFQDRRVREALGYAFDFEWTNKTLFYGLYKRLDSYYSATPSWRAGPAQPRGAEAARAVQGPAPARGLHPALRAAEDRRLRRQPRQPRAGGRAAASAAGWRVKDGSSSTARPASRCASRSCSTSPTFERDRAAVHPEPASASASRPRVRTVDPSQYQNRTDDVRLRHDGRDLWARACRRATSSASSGAATPPTPRAAATSPASRTRRSTR